MLEFYCFGPLDNENDYGEMSTQFDYDLSDDQQSQKSGLIQKESHHIKIKWSTSKCLCQ